MLRALIHKPCHLLLLDVIWVPMWPFTSKQPEPLSEELILRVADLRGAVQNMEDRIDQQLEEQQRRYQRAEQSERRLEEKREQDCEECPDEPQHANPAILALMRRRKVNGAE